MEKIPLAECITGLDGDIHAMLHPQTSCKSIGSYHACRWRTLLSFCLVESDSYLHSTVVCLSDVRTCLSNVALLSCWKGMT